jgi:lysophospholipase L1-like esterase
VLGAGLVLLGGVVGISVVTGADADAGPLAAAPRSGSRSVLLIGDSVMAALNPNYTDAARKVIGGAGWKVTIDAKVNRSTAQGVAVVRAHRAQLSDTVVVMLGHNDGATPALFARRAGQVMAALAKVPHVYWLTMRRPAYSGADQVLRTLTGSYRNLSLIDWASAVRSGWPAKDGLHLSGAGATGMARLIVASIK